MKVIIPLGGLGKRLRPHTHTRPKPLLHVAGKPILGHILDQFTPYAIEEYIFIVGYRGDQVKEYVVNNFSIKAAFLDQTELNGQAGAVYLAKEHVTEDGLIVFGDTLFDHHETDFSSLHNCGEGLFYVRQVPDPRRFGVVVTDANNRVTQLLEKPEAPPSNLVCVGMYYMKEIKLLYDAIESLIQQQRNGELYLLDAFSKLIECGHAFTTRPLETWLDCGTRESLLDTNKLLLSRQTKMEGSLQESTIIGPVYVEGGAKVIRSVVGPYVSLGKDAEVTDSRLENCILNPGAKVQRVVLEDSIIGEKATVTMASQKIDVGDDCQIGY